MIKRSCSITLCLLSILYFPYLNAQQQTFFWVLKKDDNTRLEGMITLLQQNNRTLQSTEFVCGSEDSACIMELGCECVRTNSATYTEALSLQVGFNQEQIQFEIPELLHLLLSRGGDDTESTITLSYTMQRQHSTLRSMLTAFSCLFCWPCYSIYRVLMADSIQANEQLWREQFENTTPQNLSNGITITDRQIIYRRESENSQYVETSYRVFYSGIRIISLFLMNSEAQPWLSFLLATTSSATMRLAVWIPELFDSSVIANILIQGHAQSLQVTQPVFQPLVPTHFLTFNFLEREGITVLYHIRHVQSQATQVLAVIVTLPGYSFHANLPGYDPDTHPVPPTYQEPLSPDIQSAPPAYFQVLQLK